MMKPEKYDPTKQGERRVKERDGFRTLVSAVLTARQREDEREEAKAEALRLAEEEEKKKAPPKPKGFDPFEYVRQ